MPSLQPRQRLRCDPGEVLADDLDGEIVILHLPSGNYFSLAGAGADVWRILTSGGSVGAAIDYLTRRGGSAEADIAATTLAFLGELLAEGLLAVDETTDDDGDAAAAGSDPEAPPVPAADAGASPFHPPVLNKYTDMQDLLLLDPIHEVDEAGWPAAKK